MRRITEEYILTLKVKIRLPGLLEAHEDRLMEAEQEARERVMDLGCSVAVESEVEHNQTFTEMDLDNEKDY